ncbi:MAG: hypothetical protein ACKVQC_01125 [Elusimicrobiota bacterium]
MKKSNVENINHIVGIVEKNKVEFIEVSANRINGHDIVDVRITRKLQNGQIIHTQKGVCFNPAKAEEIQLNISKAVEYIKLKKNQ